jgi:LacI family transcriptional regulator
VNSKRITLKQIAYELNVSISTVSKSLKNSAEISLETRNKIIAFAKEHNYRPNNIALSLKHRKTKTIGIIIPEIVHYFFSTVINGAEKFANQMGYNVIIAVSNESFEKEVLNMETLADSSIDGIIMSVAKETLKTQDFHHIQETIDFGIPVVLFDRVLNDIACDKVIVDDKTGAEKAVQNLLDKGCRNILLVSTQDYINVGKLRTQGYLEALKKNHMIADNRLMIKAQDLKNPEQAVFELEEQIDQAIGENSAIDGIFCVNEIYAAAALKVLKKRKIHVPNDISIICFTDGFISKYSSPTLTTVSQHGEEIGASSAQMLIDKLTNKTPLYSHSTKIIECTLVQRESS